MIYTQNRVWKDHLSLIFSLALVIWTWFLLVFAQSEPNDIQEVMPGASTTAWLRNSTGKKKKVTSRGRGSLEDLDAFPEWECLRQATATRILWQGSEGLLVSSNVAHLSVTLTPFLDTGSPGGTRSCCTWSARRVWSCGAVLVSVLLNITWL